MTASDRIELERELPASVEHVWRLWTDRDELFGWLGPRGYRCEAGEIDVRPGAAFRVVMRGPAGVPYTFAGRYLVVEPPHRLSMTWGPADAPDAATVCTIELVPRGRATLMRFTQRDIPEGDAPGYASGWSDSVDRLSERLRAG
ncbi:MAG: SRPBCC domain-containing protein [Myxococcota bacterium]